MKFPHLEDAMAINHGFYDEPTLWKITKAIHSRKRKRSKLAPRDHNIYVGTNPCQRGDPSISSSYRFDLSPSKLLTTLWTDNIGGESKFCSFCKLKKAFSMFSTSILKNPAFLFAGKLRDSSMVALPPKKKDFAQTWFFPSVQKSPSLKEYFVCC